MDRWFIFFQERFSWLYYTALSLGIALSSQYYFSLEIEVLGGLTCFVVLFILFFQLRLTDEVRDLDQDLLHHRSRPIARGLFSRLEMESYIGKIQLLLLIVTFLTWIFFSGTACFLLFANVLYVWNIYKGFYLGDLLERHVFLHSLATQLIFFLMGLFAVSLVFANLAFAVPSLQFSFMMFACFFTNDICRKLSFDKEMAEESYVQFYGVGKAFLLAAFFILLTAGSAYALDIYLLAWPAETILFLALCLFFFDPTKYKIAEKLSWVSLLYHMWAPFAFALWIY